MNTFTYYNKVSYTSVLDNNKTEISKLHCASLSCINLRYDNSRPQTTLNYQSRTLALSGVIS